MNIISRKGHCNFAVAYIFQTRKFAWNLLKIKKFSTELLQDLKILCWIIYGLSGDFIETRFCLKIKAKNNFMMQNFPFKYFLQHFHVNLVKIVCCMLWRIIKIGVEAYPINKISKCLKTNLKNFNNNLNHQSLQNVLQIILNGGTEYEFTVGCGYCQVLVKFIKTLSSKVFRFRKFGKRCGCC